LITDYLTVLYVTVPAITSPVALNLRLQDLAENLASGVVQ